MLSQFPGTNVEIECSEAEVTTRRSLCFFRQLLHRIAASLIVSRACLVRTMSLRCSRDFIDGEIPDAHTGSTRDRIGRNDQSARRDASYEAESGVAMRKGF